MGRFALFIDAGHLLAEGGKLCCATEKRAKLSCSYDAVVGALVDLCQKESGQEFLRAYWYDGARKGIPTLDHLTIASLPRIKLRLGRMSGGKQKGVDSLIVRDLMVLARQRAMSTAYLLAGDEDLREGVKDAQDFGVRVILLGVRSLEASGNQAETLVQEADDHLVLEHDFWQPHITLAPEAKETNERKPQGATDDDLGLATAAGEEFADAWLSKATPDEIAGLLGQHPYIPKELDSELLRSARGSVPTREKTWLTKSIRAAFWKRIQEHKQPAPDA